MSAAKLEVVISDGRIQRRCRSVSIIRLVMRVVVTLVVAVSKEATVRWEGDRLECNRFDQELLILEERSRLPINNYN